MQLSITTQPRKMRTFTVSKDSHKQIKRSRPSVRNIRQILRKSRMENTKVELNMNIPISEVKEYENSFTRERQKWEGSLDCKGTVQLPKTGTISLTCVREVATGRARIEKEKGMCNFSEVCAFLP
jgi:hypothetical protein